MQERTTRDKCKVCGKQGPQYTEFRENGHWYPNEDTPDDLKFGFCSYECWEAHLAQLRTRKTNQIRQREAAYGNEGRDRNGFRILDGGGRDDDERESRDHRRGHKHGRR